MNSNTICTTIVLALCMRLACQCDVWNVPCRAGEAAVSSSSAGPGGLSPLETKPVERQVEARPVDDSLGSMVRCLYFAKTFLITGM
jgi:hypothetical protein